MLDKCKTYLKKSSRFKKFLIVLGFIGLLGISGASYVPDIIVKGAPWYDIRAYASLSAALTAIGSSEKTLLIVTNVAVPADATIPSTTHVWYLGGGKFTIASGKVLTHHGSISAPNTTIWVGPGTIVPPATPLDLAWTGGLTQAVALLGSNPCQIIISGAYTQTANVTIPITMGIRFNVGGSVTLSAARTWTLNGRIEGVDSCLLGDGAFVLSNLQPLDASWWPGFTKAITDIGSNSRELLVRLPQTISGTLATPSTLPINVIPGGSLNPAGGTTLTINGNLTAGFYQIFNGAGTIVVNSSTSVYPEWWHTGIADWQPAIQKAVNALPPLVGGDNGYFAGVSALGGFVKLQKREYKVYSPIVLLSFQGLIGSGPGTLISNYGSGTPAIQIGDTTNPVIRATVRDLTIDGRAPIAAAGAHGIAAWIMLRSYIGPIWIANCGEHGINMIGGSYSYIQDSYIQNCFGNGIRLYNGGGDYWLTDTRVVNSTIRSNYLAGVLIDGVTAAQVRDCTIESNGYTPEYLGYGSLKSSETYSLNLHLLHAMNCDVDHNYFEEGSGGTYARQTQIGMSGGYLNRISNNSFHNYVSLRLFSDDSTVVWNTIVNNNFDYGVNPNVITNKATAQVNPNSNYFNDNTGMNWSDVSGVYTGNYVTVHNHADTMLYEIQESSGDASYTPDLGLATSTSNPNASGLPNGHIIELTLTQNITINIPINSMTGQIVIFRFIQAGSGGYTVTFSALYKNGWSNAGNVVNSYSTVMFYNKSGTWHQLGGQCLYH